ncbi:MAG: type I CRISPR-associated protein Cas8a1/Csx8 [Peptostreptococcus sp.]|uniref:type I CRISPR-associated protein Cas8a1/Csx8 n=1 Tax=Peptostreptococcus sp. TaxID=1262 RepID=UPI002FCB44CE
MIKRDLKGKFDTVLEFSDWRYSASAVGLMRYFEEMGFVEGDDYSKTYEEEHIIDGESEIIIRNDVLCYNTKDILLDDEENRKRYLDFVEKYFKSKMYHLGLKALIKKDTLSDEDVKSINDLMNSKAIMKKVFKEIDIDIDSDKSTKKNVLNLMEKNRYNLIEEAYKNATATYKKFCNQNSFGTVEGKVCRLVGYYVDLSKKKKSMAFNWDYNTYVYEDCPEFDYIPFAFSKTRDAFFINNNINAKELLKANENLNNSLSIENHVIDDNKSARSALFLSSSKAAQFINYQVEIIIKNRDKDYFETMFVRDEAIDIFRKISGENKLKESKKGYEYILMALNNPCIYGSKKLEKVQYLNISSIVVDSILNILRLDPLIDKLLKDRKENDHSFLISQLIIINTYIYEKLIEIEITYNFNKKDIIMNSIDKKEYLDMNEIKDINNSTRGAAYAAASIMEKNKVTGYRNKLISCLTFKDYDRFCTVLLQLSAYSKINFVFAYKLFEDFEKNKNLAYIFVNSFVKDEKKEKKEKKEV